MTYDAEAEMTKRRVRLVSKLDSKLMLAAEILLLWSPDFATEFWTTLTLPGWRVIYYPTGMTREAALKSVGTIAHELEHVDQADGPLPSVAPVRWAWNLLFGALYLLAFLPVGLAYFRARWEARAYARGYVTHLGLGTMRWSLDSYADWVADAVAGGPYVWAWPRAWVRGMFLDRVGQLSG